MQYIEWQRLGSVGMDAALMYLLMKKVWIRECGGVTGRYITVEARKDQCVKKKKHVGMSGKECSFNLSVDGGSLD